MDRRSDGQAQTNMPPQLLRSWGHNEIGQVVSGKNSFENVDNRQQKGDRVYHLISSPNHLLQMVLMRGTAYVFVEK